MSSNDAKAAVAKTVYVSITGLKLKRWWHFFRFMSLTIPATRQARRSAGNISVELTKSNGVYHTLTVWHREEDMRNFLYEGAHLRAVRAFGDIADGKTFGFETTEPPAMNDVHSLWLEHGREYAVGAIGGQN
jgi:hypothetical protein